ncbi:MAG: ATP-grasp domain-containing protein [Thermoanaerobaculia bacterium]|nr:ATP-grasp domain-containing protein [Thermoanaerobaculia bacterium]
MAYLIIDPCGDYPSHLMRFLAGRDKGAVAVFSSPGRYMLWRDKWSKSLEQWVLDEFLATQAPSLASLAAHIHHAWPRLEGVIPWDEESILLGADLGERLGLGWNPRRVIERCRDKAVMKDWLRQHAGVRINAARVVSDGHQALEFQRQVGSWPVVVKPTEGSGSENVFFATDDDELLSRCQRVMQSGDGGVLLEEFIGGREFAVNGIVDARGDLLVTDVWVYDRRTNRGAPNVYYQSIKVSSREAVFHSLGNYAAAVVESLELRRAPIHMEVKVDDRGPCLIEVGARLSGANLPMLASKLHGRSLFELAACHYLADLPLKRSEVDFERYDRFEARVINGVQADPIPRIRAVHGVREVEALPSFDGFGLLRPVGTSAPLSVDVDSRAYDVFLIHPDGDQIRRDAEAVRRLLGYD